MGNTHHSKWKQFSTLGQGILNGIVGDYLQQQNNGLAIKMAFYHQDRPLALTSETIATHRSQISDKLCILAHGLTNTESIWQYPDKAEPDYGAALAKDLGYTPFYLRYNSGLSIGDNGHQLAELIDQLITHYPLPVREITLIGFSMGGLVIRSACHQVTDHRWLEKVKHCIYIGSPLHGAPLEKFGQLATSMARHIPRDYVHAFADIIDTRSRGIKDLHSGEIRKEISDDENHYVLAKNCHHYAISGGLDNEHGSWLNKVIGDGLVRHSSATGKHKAEEKDLGIPIEKQKHFPGLHHIALAHNHLVYQQIREWCTT